MSESSNEKKAELLDFLISKGADINFQDEEGRTLLMSFIIYSGYGGLEDFKLLIFKGADHKIKDKEGKTALDYALERDNFEEARKIAEFLKTLN